MKFMERFKRALIPHEELIDRAYGLFGEFYNAYTAEWERLDKCERYYLGDHWKDIQKKDPNEPRPTTNVIQSTIENICADLMDSIPEAIIRPENPQDDRVARVVDALIRQNHDAAAYEREYWKLAHDLLTAGYMAQEVGYDPLLNNGIGGAFIRHVDVRNILFDPQCSDIHDGRGVFKIASRTIKWLEQQFPKYKGQFKQDEYRLQEDSVLDYDQTKSMLLIEYWWREFKDGQYQVHMAKIAGHKLLEDSREQKPDGYFSHGQYPFIVTPLFIRKGSALGFGVVDMFGEQQLFADKLDQIVLKNALMASRNKMLVTKASGFDAEDLSDWAKEVHEGENLNGVTWFPTPSLPQYIIQYAQAMRQGVKEESGANDFSRGTTSSGVTAASAIAALQDASSKRSRMAARQMHGAYKDAVRMEIEVEREYNILPRQVLLSIDGQQEVATFESALLERQAEEGAVPIEFMISIKVQRENRWSVMAHNELVMQMVQFQILQPQQAVELMQFEGREILLNKAAKQPQIPPEQQEAMQQQAIQQQLAAQMQQIPAPEQAIL